MTVVVVGLNYRTAPVEIREKLTLSGCTLQIALQDLCGYDSIDEVVILSTCNRLEVYASCHHTETVIQMIEGFLAQFQNINLSGLKNHLYDYIADKAVNHLMRVTCGLDSMILGESQILGQVTQAYESAQKASATGAILSHLFFQAIHTGKRARHETAISRYTTSVSHAGARHLLDKLQQRRDAHILILGAGEMAVLAAQALKRFGFQDLTFINRTYNRAEAMAAEFGGKAEAWHQLKDMLIWADAVICATAAPHTIITQDEIATILPKRATHPLHFMDIAVPRDVEEAVSQLANVHVYDIDNLQSVVDNNVELRKAAIPQVEQIIGQEMARFSEWYHSRQVTPVIRTLREWAQSIAEEELLQTLNRLSDQDERTHQIVRLLVHRLVNRLLHEPTSRLRMQASEGNGYGYAHAIRELFALNELDALQCQQDTCASYISNNNECTLHCILPQFTGQST